MDRKTDISAISIMSSKYIDKICLYFLIYFNNQTKHYNSDNWFYKIWPLKMFSLQNWSIWLIIENNSLYIILNFCDSTNLSALFISNLMYLYHACIIYIITFFSVKSFVKKHNENIYIYMEQKNFVYGLCVDIKYNNMFDFKICIFFVKYM